MGSKIHTAKLRDNKLLDRDVNLEELASLTKNFSGAELKGLATAATSFAFSRHTEVDTMAAVKDDVASIEVNREDFMKGLTEVRPAYGVSEGELEEAVQWGIINYSPHVNNTIEEMSRLAGTIRKNPRMTNTSVLFHGPQGSGKTALAAQIATNSDFPFVKIIRPSDLAGYRDEFAKKDYIHKVFTDAYKSPISLLILDEFESLIEWNDIGPRFSMTLLGLLTTLIAANPPKVYYLSYYVFKPC